jgi:hypothetical protein
MKKMFQKLCEDCLEHGKSVTIEWNKVEAHFQELNGEFHNCEFRATKYKPTDLSKKIDHLQSQLDSIEMKINSLLPMDSKE